MTMKVDNLVFMMLRTFILRIYKAGSSVTCQCASYDRKLPKLRTFAEKYLRMLPI